ncbi:MAG TPA: RHS repeat-associated core domain-containing protein [Anaerolineales bacterium]|nr:RHS repeat-associated core domain-containing protein [Anaerolineales bacterium]
MGTAHTITTDILSLPGGLVPRKLAGYSNGEANYYQLDALGSGRAVTGAGGAVQGEFADYSDFGTRLSPAPTPLAPSFTGYEHDAYTGLEYAKNRYYDPATASFISSDPYPVDHSDLLGANLYNYVQGNPVNSTDPLGWFNWGTRTVEYGDTVNSIAESWGISPNIIYSRNPQIASARAIFPGQYVSLPVCDNAKCQETLVKWTAIHDATVPTICDKNGTVAQYVKSCAEPSQTLENAIHLLLTKIPLYHLREFLQAMNLDPSMVIDASHPWNVLVFYGTFYYRLGYSWYNLPDEFKLVYSLMKPIGVACVDLPQRWQNGDEAIVGNAHHIDTFDDPINIIILAVGGGRAGYLVTSAVGGLVFNALKEILRVVLPALCLNDGDCTNEASRLTEALCNNDGDCFDEINDIAQVVKEPLNRGLYDRTWEHLFRPKDPAYHGWNKLIDVANEAQRIQIWNRLYTIATETLPKTNLGTSEIITNLNGYQVVIRINVIESGLRNINGWIGTSDGRFPTFYYP